MVDYSSDYCISDQIQGIIYAYIGLWVNTWGGFFGLVNYITNYPMDHRVFCSLG